MAKVANPLPLSSIYPSRAFLLRLSAAAHVMQTLMVGTVYCTLSVVNVRKGDGLFLIVHAPRRRRKIGVRALFLG